MSDTEHWRGTIYPVAKGPDVEEAAGAALRKRGCEVENDVGYTALEQLLDCYTRDYTYFDEILYEIKGTPIDPDADVSLAAARGGGRIEFEVRFYNGGCCLSEAIKEAVQSI